MKKLFLLAAMTIASGFACAQMMDMPMMGGEGGGAFNPPLIPHPVAQYLPITPDKNMCLMCHKPAEPGVTPMAPNLPPSHLIDGHLAPMRWDCMMCHQEAPGVGQQPAP